MLDLFQTIIGNVYPSENSDLVGVDRNTQANATPIIGTGFSLVVVEQPGSALDPYQQNACIHAKDQILQIANSILAFGFTNPVLVDADNRIVAGHGRVEAAKILGMKSVPTIRLPGLVRFRAKNRPIKK